MKHTPARKNVIKQGFEEGMFKHLQEHMDDALKKKLPVSVLREVLIHLADWAYVERNKWLGQFQEGVERRAGQRIDELKEKLKPDVVETTFLDALDDIR